MTLKSTAKKAVSAVKANPALALMLVGLFAPKVAAKLVTAAAVAKAAKQTD